MFRWLSFLELQGPWQTTTRVLNSQASGAAFAAIRSDGKARKLYMELKKNGPSKRMFVNH